MKSNFCGRILTMLVLALAVTDPRSMLAQESRGTITGTVTDSAKAVIQGASVKVTNVAMGTTVSIATNDSGLYRAPYLIPGTYQIAVEAAGFKKYLRDGVTIRINDTIEINVTLELGEVQETITVTSDAPLLETTSGSASQSVDARRVSELPMPHGQPYNLIGLSTGVAFCPRPKTRSAV